MDKNFYCDICYPGRQRQVKPTKIIGQIGSGELMSCYSLACGHAWHIVLPSGALVECTCPDYVPSKARFTALGSRRA